MRISTSSVTRPLALTAVTGLMISLAACSGPADTVTGSAPTASPTASTSPSASESSTPTASTSSSATASDSATATADASAALLAAGHLGVRAVSGGTVVSIEAERNGWEVHVVTGTGAEQELRTDAGATRVVSGPTDDRPDADDRTENQQFAAAEVDYREAVRAIEREVAGGQITELGLDRENRRTVWEADVSVDSQQRTVQVDAGDASVVSNRTDD